MHILAILFVIVICIILMAPGDDGDPETSAAPKSSEERFEEQRVTRDANDHQAHRPHPTYNSEGKNNRAQIPTKNLTDKSSTEISDTAKADPSVSNSDTSEKDEPAAPPEAPVSPSEWAAWAKGRNWEFYPETQYARMAMHGTYGEYVVQVYSRSVGGLDQEPRDETEFRIQLLNGTPEGLYIGPISHMSKILESEPESRPISISPALDNNLIALTQDNDATRFLFSHPEILEALEALNGAHPLSRVNNRIVSLRKLGISPSDFDDWVDKTLFLATTIDSCVNRAWEQIAEKYTLRLRPPDRNGFPSLRGKIDGHQVKISITTGSGLTTYLRISLGVEFPHDLTLIGSQYTKPEGLTPLSDVDYSPTATAYAEYPERALLILNNPEVKEVLSFIFETIPQSDIQYGELRLRIQGRLDENLNGVLTESITVAKMLNQAAIPDHVIIEATS